MKRTIIEGYSIEEAFKALNERDSLKLAEAKSRKGQGFRWKNNDIGKTYGFNEDDYVVHHINGDPEFDIDPETGEPNLALIPSDIHNKFKKDNLGEWQKIKQDFDTSNIVDIKGVKFILALPKTSSQLSNRNTERDLALV